MWQGTDTQTAMTNIHFASAALHAKCKKYTKKLKRDKSRDKSRVRRDHPRCHSTMWICMYGHTPDSYIFQLLLLLLHPFNGLFQSYIFQVSSKSVQGFWSPGGGQNLAIPITLAIGFYNSLYYIQAVIHQYESSLIEMEMEKNH